MTNSGLALTRQDRERLHVLMSQFSSTAGFQITLANLIKRWEQLVQEVQQGYSVSIYEYTNDLGSRDLLATTEAILSDDGKKKLSEFLLPVDDMFRRNTDPLPHSIGGQLPPPSNWWWYRVPKKLSDELRNDLNSEGRL